MRLSSALLPVLLVLPGLRGLPELAGPGPPSIPAPEATGPASRRSQSSLEELERWVAEFRRNGPVTSAERVQRLSQLTSELRMKALSSPRQRREITLGLLDLAGVRTMEQLRRARRSGEPPAPDPQTLRIRIYGERELVALLAADRDHELASWMAATVLVLPTQPEPRRVAALVLLRDSHLASTQLALFYCTRDPSPPVREAALLALVGWNDEGVHRVMLRQLELLGEDPDWVQRSTIQRHFRVVSLDPALESGERMYVLTRSGISSLDWRRAFRALQLIPACGTIRPCRP